MITIMNNLLLLSVLLGHNSVKNFVNVFKTTYKNQ